MSKKLINKKILSLFLAVLTAFSVFLLPTGAVEAEKNREPIQNSDFAIVSPIWENISKDNLVINFSNNKIYAKITLSGKSGVKYKDGTVLISKYSGGKYVPVKKWTGLSSARTNFVFSNSELSAVSGVKYKLSIKITAYTSSKSEVVTANKVATCP